MQKLLGFLPFVVMVPAVAFAIRSTIAALKTLRAKHKVHEKLAERAQHDQGVNLLIEKMRGGGNLTDGEVEAAKNLVSEVSRHSLSEREQHLVEIGLRQRGKSDAQRYIKDVLTAA
jgi:hypothetical protein